MGEFCGGHVGAGGRGREGARKTQKKVHVMDCVCVGGGGDKRIKNEKKKMKSKEGYRPKPKDCRGFSSFSSTIREKCAKFRQFLER
jgi:hypothetical protein